MNQNSNLERATLACGCFWGAQSFFKKLNGVYNTQVGYSGGDEENPSYELVKSQKTKHKEVISFQYDPALISYEEILNKYFDYINPFQEDGQGVDIGYQYISTIFSHNSLQQRIADATISKLSEKKGRNITTQIQEVKQFHKAEEYHQNYLEKNQGVSCNLAF